MDKMLASNRFPQLHLLHNISQERITDEKHSINAPEVRYTGVVGVDPVGVNERLVYS
jgi:hypothetical protein